MRETLLKSKNDNFELVTKSGIGVEDTPYEGLEVIRKGLADKHVVDVRLKSSMHDFNGTPVKYKYYGAYVAHGMRSEQDTLDETLEYIKVLGEAVEFTRTVIQYIEDTGWNKN